MGRSAVLPVLFAAILTVGAPVAAQEPDTTAVDTVSGVATDTLAAPSEAPEPIVPRLAVALTLNRASTDRLQGQPVLARRLGPEGGVQDSAVIDRLVEADPALQLGVSALLSLDRIWAVRLGAGAGSMTFRTRYLADDTLFAGPAGRIAADEATDVFTGYVEGALRMRLLSPLRMQPYLELGAAAVRWDADGPLVGDASLGEGVTRIAPLAALGAVIPVTERVAAAIQLSTRTFRTAVSPAPAGSDGGSAPGMSITFLEPGATRFADGADELTSMFRIDLGVSYGFGAISTSSASATPAPTGG